MINSIDAEEDLVPFTRWWPDTRKNWDKSLTTATGEGSRQYRSGQGKWGGSTGYSK
jgi:hypothetical protein